MVFGLFVVYFLFAVLVIEYARFKKSNRVEVKVKKKVKSEEGVKVANYE